jgi:membrane protein YdbS with pleckstrin-like domain
VPFPPELLTDDEELVLDLRPHWWYITPASVYLGLAVLVGLVALLNDWPDAVKVLIGLLVLVALGYFAQRYARWATTNFVVTTERVVSRMGVVAKKGIEIPLDRINTVFFNQSFFERLLGAGDLGIESAGEGGRQTFSDIRKPSLVQQEIYRQKETFERRRLSDMGRTIASQFPGQQGTPGPQGPTHSVPEQIEHLDRLRRSGAITEDEYQAKKTELLRRM